MKQQLKLTLGKAFSLNENKNIYGAFAEIGAGQETVNFFFKAGRASQTVAKSMSAYDMTFSNLIYGKESRYVSQHRLTNMLKHEYRLLWNRLRSKRGKDTRFFAFANTATTVSNRNQDPTSHHGWLGLRFQTKPMGAFNDVILHVNCLDKNRLQQHEALGILGVNLIYACFYKTSSLKAFVSSLMENLDTDRLRINWVNCNGPYIKKFNPTLINMELLKQKISPVVFFNSKGECEFIKDSIFNTPLFIVTNKIGSAQNEILKNAGKEKFKSYKALSHITFEEIKGKNIVSCIRSFSKNKRALLVSSEKDLRSLKQVLHFYTTEKLCFAISEEELKNLFASPSLLKSMGLLFDNHTKIAVKGKSKKFSLETYRLNGKSKQLLKDYLISEKKLFPIF